MLRGPLASSFTLLCLPFAGSQWDPLLALQLSDALQGCFLEGASGVSAEPYLREKGGYHTHGSHAMIGSDTKEMNAPCQGVHGMAASQPTWLGGWMVDRHPPAHH